jgi:hypothetical protein
VADDRLEIPYRYPLKARWGLSSAHGPRHCPKPPAELTLGSTRLLLLWF